MRKIEGEGEPGKELRLSTAIPAVVTSNFFLTTGGMAVGGRGSLRGFPSTIFLRALIRACVY